MNLVLAGCAQWGPELGVSQEQAIICPQVSLDKQVREVSTGNKKPDDGKEHCRVPSLPVDGTVIQYTSQGMKHV